MPALSALTADEIDTLARILAKLRPHGARQWDPAGIVAQLRKTAQIDAANVILAAVRLSQDRTAVTPAQIATPSAECWRERTPDWRPAGTKPSYCRTHQTPLNAVGECRSCRADQIAAPSYGEQHAKEANTA